ncbi:hypothetical protein ACFV27_01065 [Streptomyces antimycoticus]|uniref:hypothetical protein n=1 Tax=Streptomyces antimycoticus TaxID=68175 RepID=UPI0036A4E378
MPGNPLGGMLRDLDRRTRTTTRRTGRQAAEDEATQPRTGPRGARGPAGPPGAPGPSTTAATVATTGEDSRARFDFPAPYAAPPVLTALAVDPEPEDDRAVTVALETVTEAYAVVRVWRTRPRRGQGVAAPAGPGITVHLTASAPPT